MSSEAVNVTRFLPIVSIELAFEEEHTEDATENDNGASKHLPH